MKEGIKKMLVLLFCVSLISCEDKSVLVEKIDNYTSVIEIDECEYIQREKRLAHKGNCKNKIHIYNK